MRLDTLTIRLAVLAMLAAAAGNSAAAGPTLVQPIYRCEAGHVTVFSDRPCAIDAQIYSADTDRVSHYEPPAHAADSIQLKKTQKPKARKPASAAAAAKQAARCERIQESLREIRSKMRSGYTVKQGEKLKQRRVKLETQRRSQRCR